MQSTSSDFAAAHTEGLSGPSEVVVLCEHASAVIPAQFGNLGLGPDVRISHIAWDPGALDLARHLARVLRAPLVSGGVSRLLYDCNRPPEAPDSVPERSEVFEVPGNRDLSPAERAARVARIYEPFCMAVDRAMETANAAALVTVHSFTPVYFSKPRDVEIGVLHDSDSRLADALLDGLSGSRFRVERNRPYGPEDGVTHSLKRHAMSRGIANVMLEVRNDLLSDAGQAAQIADLLAGALPSALARVRAQQGAV